jgi:hypothetical protein
MIRGDEGGELPDVQHAITSFDAYPELISFPPMSFLLYFWRRSQGA